MNQAITKFRLKLGKNSGLQYLTINYRFVGFQLFCRVSVQLWDGVLWMRIDVSFINLPDEFPELAGFRMGFQRKNIAILR